MVGVDTGYYHDHVLSLEPRPRLVDRIGVRVSANFKLSLKNTATLREGYLRRIFCRGHYPAQCIQSLPESRHP